MVWVSLMFGTWNSSAIVFICKVLVLSCFLPPPRVPFLNIKIVIEFSVTEDSAGEVPHLTRGVQNWKTAPPPPPRKG